MTVSNLVITAIDKKESKAMKMMTRTVWNLAARMKFTYFGDKTAGIAYQPT